MSRVLMKGNEALAEEVKELDINPLFVYEDGQGLCAADALVVLGQ